MWVLTARGNAAEVLKSHSQLENSSAQSAAQIIEQGIGVQVMLLDLTKTLAKHGNPVLPAVELTPSGIPQGPGLEENIPEARKAGLKPDTPVHAEITLTGSAVFKEHRLIGWLDMKETRGVLWLTNQMNRAFITIPSITETNKNITVRLTESRVNIEPNYDGKNIWFDVMVVTEGDILEQQSDEDLSNPEIIGALSQRLSETIKQRMQMVLDKAQYEYRLDIFGLGDDFHRKYKKEWPKLKDRWDEEFSNAQVNITVQSNIRRSGLMTKSD